MDTLIVAIVSLQNRLNLNKAAATNMFDVAIVSLQNRLNLNYFYFA